MAILKFRDRTEVIPLNPAVALLGNEPAGAAFNLAADQHFICDTTTPANSKLGTTADLIASGHFIYSRNSSASGVGRLGLIEQFASNVPRLVYDPSSLVTSAATIQFRLGAKAMTVAAGYTYAAGDFVALTDAGTTARWMRGRVISHVSTLLVIEIYWVASGVSGSASSWTIIKSLGYLSETQATNLALWSEQLDNAAVSKVAATVSANAANAPDGNLTADKIQEDNTVSTHYVAPPALTCVSGTTYSFSAFVKAAERGFALFVMAGSSFPLAGITVDLSTGTAGTAIGSPLSAKSEKAANGFWRISFSLAATANAADNIISVRASLDGVWANRSYQGVAGSGIYAWGIQPEASGAATSYIPTAGGTVQRIGDLLLLNMAKVPALGSAYSIVAGGYARKIGATGVIAALTNSAAPSFNNCLYISDNGTATVSTGLNIRSASTTTTAIARVGYSYGAGGLLCAAARVKVGDSALSVNASPIVTSATSALPAIAMDRLAIGQDWGLSGASANGWGSTIAAVSVIPRDLSNAQLQARSTL